MEHPLLWLNKLPRFAAPSSLSPECLSSPLVLRRLVERIDPQHAVRSMNLLLQFLSSTVRIDEAFRRTFERKFMTHLDLAKNAHRMRKCWR